MCHESSNVLKELLSISLRHGDIATLAHSSSLESLEDARDISASYLRSTFEVLGPRLIHTCWVLSPLLVHLVLILRRGTSWLV